MKDSKDLFSNDVDYKKLFNKFLLHRNLFFACVIFLLIVAFLVNRFAVTKYSNKTTIYLTQSDNNSLLNSSDMSFNFGMFSNQKIVDNELEILKSYSLINRVVDDLDLKVTYYSTNTGTLASMLTNTPFTRKTEHYGDSPIRIIVDPSVPQPVYLVFKIVFLNEDEFMLECHGKEVSLYNYIDDNTVSYVPELIFNRTFRFDDEIKSQYFNFKIVQTRNFSEDFTQYRNLYFYFNNMNDLTLTYQSELSAESTSQNSTIIEATFKDTHPEKVTDFLNMLTAAYLEKNIEKKNKMASSTVSFIDSQISDISDSLTYTESTLRNFRMSEGVTDLSYQGQQIIEQLTRLEDQKASLEAQKKYYESLQAYLNQNYDISNLPAPSLIDLVDPILTSLITSLIEDNAERARLLRNNSNQQNLYLNDVNARIEQTKRTLLETVNNNLSTLNISLNEVNYRINRANYQISEIPKTELQLRNIERKFDLNDAIYTFLLQKRSEAQIAKASSMPDYEIVDPAISAMVYPVWPKSKLNYLLALFIGLLLPASFIMLKDFFNNKLVDTEEVEQLANYPILGRVFHSYHRSRLVVNDHPNSSVTESFRSIRTNFQFFSGGGKKQIVLITSTSSGEGKTFCSMNLASVFALNGHRTVLLEFDLRRPKIYQEFTSNNMIGISSFLIDKAVLEDVILPTQIENMDFIPAGPAAPNPAELINSDRTAELIDKLREMYDYIIIDSAPAGILTETHVLMKYADLNVLVGRLNKTIKEAFKQTLKNIETNNIKNLSLITNDIYVNRESYKYGYDKKYYTDDSNRNFLQRILNWRKKAS